VRLPEFLRGQVQVAGVDLGVYRLFLVAMVAGLTAALALLVRRTRFGAQVRAAVDDARVARGLGIDVDRVFAVTFALGSGLAGLGGALGIDVLGLDPTFPLK
jgi:branched-chain amino acid transport system permease protein